MKSNTRRGHSINCRGAKGILDEIDVCTPVHNTLKADLQKLGMYGVDCTSTSSSVNGDLSYGVNKNNSNKADYFVSIHANVTKGGHGSEIWLYPNASEDIKNKANNILKKLEKLGFKNRGIKYSSGLYELRATNNKAMIIELFFLDSEKDVALYRKLGAEKIGHTIAEGMTGKTISNSNQTQPQKPVKQPSSVLKLIPQKGKCTVVVDELMIREEPSTKSKAVGSYTRNQSVYYDYYVDNEGYRWISWIGGSGKRRYMAVRVLSNNKRYGNCV